MSKNSSTSEEKKKSNEQSSSSPNDSDNEGDVGATGSKSSSHDTNKSDDELNDPSLERIRLYLQNKLGFYMGVDDDKDGDDSKKVIEDLSFDGLMKHWKEKGFKNIITMVGAGISTSAGIPDFRSPGSGLYHNLEKYKLPYPTAIFEIDYFIYNPKPFYVLAKELYPGTFKPTPCHYFIKLLQEKNLLLRHYTQNIDTLERLAGVKDDKLVEAHGTFYTNHCLKCSKLFSMEWMKEQIFNDNVPICDECENIVKPDIVFFGENLPDKFYSLPGNDFKKCDLLIIMGTSLEVQPFATLFERCKKNCVRLLINKEKVANRNSDNNLSSWFTFSKGLRYDADDNTRDIAWIGDCDDGIYAITDALGWTDELNEMISKGHAELDKINKLQKENTDEGTNDEENNEENENESTNDEISDKLTTTSDEKKSVSTASSKDH